MSGLDKIIEKINADSLSACKKIIADAESEAQRIIADAQKQGEAEAVKAAENAAERAEAIARMSQANCQQQTRRTLLAAKVDAVQDAVTAAMQSLKNMPQGEYFTALSSLAVNNAQAGEGELRLNAEDLSKIPSDFESGINEALPADRRVRVAASPADIDSGFILVYGDIEINCTFDALAESKLDAVKEKVCSIIFQ